MDFFNCKHFIYSPDFVPTPFGIGDCEMPGGECAIDSDSDDCSKECKDYTEE